MCCTCIMQRASGVSPPSHRAGGGYYIYTELTMLSIHLLHRICEQGEEQMYMYNSMCVILNQDPVFF